jgi:pimeloyl-ACP methyl ester carboxylesterase
MRILLTALTAAVLVTAPLGAEDAKSRFFTASDGTKIHYFELGAGGTPVILIHGYTANAEGKWIKSGIAQALAARHRVIAIDARGHGQSDKPHDPGKYGPRMAQDVIELMDHVKIAKAHIHGYSMGGAMLAEILAHNQDRLITAIFGGSGPQETDPAIIAKVPKDVAAPAATDPNAPRGENWSSYPGYDRAALDAVQKYPWKPEDRAIDLSKVKVPVLQIVGSFDNPNARTHRIKRELKAAQVVIVPNATHGSAHLDPVYTPTLVKFIDAHDR